MVSRCSCRIGNRDVKPEVVKRDFRCSACEGALELLPVVDDSVVVGYTIWCHHCNAEATPVHVGEIRSRFVDAFKVAQSLPARFSQYVTGESGVDIDVESAKEALFGE